MIKENKSFILDRLSLELYKKSIFYAEVSRSIKKVESRDVSTACVTYDEKNKEFVMLWNYDFVKALTQEEGIGLVAHELNHVILGHLTHRFKKDVFLWNIASDLSNNSIIIDSFGINFLPKGALFPGILYKNDENKRIEKFFNSLPLLKSAEFYYELVEKNKHLFVSKDGNPLFGNEDSFDEHKKWNVFNEIDYSISGEIQSIVKNAIEKAIKSSGWGSVSVPVQELIMASNENKINWVSVLRNFVNGSIRSNKKSTLKRINKRFPWVHPGKKVSYNSKFLVAIDQSGSVSNELLEKFFSEISFLTKLVEFDVVYFDCSKIKKEDIITLEKNDKTKSFARKKMGGTNFNVVIDFVNSRENSGKWDGLIFMTDGMASPPKKCKLKKCWILDKKHKLSFQTTDRVIKIC